MPTLTRLLPVLLFAIPVAAEAQQPQPTPMARPEIGTTAPRGGGEIIVHLSRFRDNPHAATMAVNLANTLQAQGGNVVLFLDVEGVRLADARQRVAGGTSAPRGLDRHLEDFVNAGGRIAVCAHCAEVAGMSGQTLRRGATLVEPAQAAMLVRGAKTVIDY